MLFAELCIKDEIALSLGKGPISQQDEEGNEEVNVSAEGGAIRRNIVDISCSEAYTKLFLGGTLLSHFGFHSLDL